MPNCVYFPKNEYSQDRVLQSVHTQLSSNIRKWYPWKVVWRNVFLTLLIHCFAIYGLFRLSSAHLATILFMFLLISYAQIGVLVGAHRLWSHRSFKANTGVRWFLSIGHVMAFQKSTIAWVRDHLVHHKYSDTDADPHNSKRGFFFSHLGWVLIKKLPEVSERGHQLDLSQLYADPILSFQSSHFLKLATVFHFLLPTVIPVLCWSECWSTAALLCVFTRHAYTLHMTFLINSWSHLHGDRQYDANIAPVECSIRHLLFGEGFHNYHHTFPWDYTASELNSVQVFNPPAAVIDFFCAMGWATDLKRANSRMVAHRKCRTGQPTMNYNRSNGLFEWTTGLMAVFGPFLVIRYIAMHFGY